MEKSPVAASRQAVRLKVRTVVDVGLASVCCGLTVAYGSAWWQGLAVVAPTGLVVWLARAQWASLQRGAPVLSLLDAITPYARDMAPGHTRVFDRIGAEVSVLCTRQRSQMSFHQFSQEDLLAFDETAVEPTRLITTRIDISGPLTAQWVYVISSDPEDPLKSRAPGWLRSFMTMTQTPKTDAEQPTVADMTALLDHLRNSDLVRDVPPASAKKS
ncbi:hypothetical protein [Streptomyces cyaneofuscatus]|uniref:hypothetical protein n=1 Tax=Streptomyces cyaneofuscatus TaxID=66883 RepID=UPI0034317F43